MLLYPSVDDNNSNFVSKVKIVGVYISWLIRVRAHTHTNGKVKKKSANVSMLLKNIYHLLSHCIYNINKSGISIEPNKPSTLLSVKCKHTVKSNFERSSNVTLIGVIWTPSDFISPACMFGRNIMKSQNTILPRSIGEIYNIFNDNILIDILTHNIDKCSHNL